MALQHGLRLARAVDVAVGDDRDLHGGLDRGHRLVLGLALVALLARAAVDGQHLHASGLGGARDHRGVPGRVAPAGAHLQRHGHALRFAKPPDRLDDLQRERLVLHQRRTGPLVADLLGRTAHVDVDDLRATVDVVARGLGHHLGVGAGDLDRDRARLAAMVGTARGLEGVAQVGTRGHHLADGVAGTELLAQAAERSVRHTRHGGDEQGVR